MISSISQIPSTSIANRTINLTGFVLLSLGVSAAWSLFLYIDALQGRKKRSAAEVQSRKKINGLFLQVFRRQKHPATMGPHLARGFLLSLEWYVVKCPSESKIPFTDPLSAYGRKQSQYCVRACRYFVKLLKLYKKILAHIVHVDVNFPFPIGNIQKMLPSKSCKFLHFLVTTELGSFTSRTLDQNLS